MGVPPNQGRRDSPSCERWLNRQDIGDIQSPGFRPATHSPAVRCCDGYLNYRRAHGRCQSGCEIGCTSYLGQVFGCGPHFIEAATEDGGPNGEEVFRALA